MSPRARQLATKNAGRVAAANADRRDNATFARQMIVGLIAVSLSAWMAVCIVGAMTGPARRQTTTRNAVGQQVSISRSSCLALARQWQRETDRVKRLDHATFYNQRRGCPEAHGTKAQLPGLDR